MDDMVKCPNCGADIRKNARVCPECGSDEETGWSERTYLDNLGIPEPDEYDEIAEQEFGSSEKHGAKGFNWKAVVALGVAAVFLLLSLRLTC
jgi:RNA polymerase subunit RPABC4/transcription elongation factor Spt4